MAKECPYRNYEVGRYLDFEKVDDLEHVYTIDFNLAYNSYWAYSTAYGCAIPREEDPLDLAITTGEKMARLRTSADRRSQGRAFAGGRITFMLARPPVP